MAFTGKMAYQENCNALLGCDETTYQVFVGRIPSWVVNKQLSTLAKPFNCKNTRVLPKADRLGFKCGFVTFTNVSMAQEFINEYHNQDIFDCGEMLNCRFSDGDSGKKKKLFFGGLAAHCTEQDLHDMVVPFGTVLSTQILNKGFKPCGFVCFATAQQADQCIKGLNNMKNPFDRTRKIVVRLARAESAKQKASKNAASKKQVNMKQHFAKQDSMYMASAPYKMEREYSPSTACSSNENFDMVPPAAAYNVRAPPGLEHLYGVYA